MHPVEITWYKFLVLLTAAMGIAFGITNVVYFNRIRVNDDCNEISSGTATTLLWLNILLVVFSAIIFFWSLYRLVFTGEEEKDLTNTTYRTHVHNYSEPVNATDSPTLESTYTTDQPEPL